MNDVHPLDRLKALEWKLELAAHGIQRTIEALKERRRIESFGISSEVKSEALLAELESRLERFGELQVEIDKLLE